MHDQPRMTSADAAVNLTQSYLNPAPPAAPSRCEETKTALALVFSWMRDLLFSVVIAIVVILFLYQPVKVEGTSMMPALEDQERIFINKYVYRFGIGEIMRGDMVVFHYPHDPSKSYIKRVIGLPGDTVAMEDGVVFVNGKRLEEDYVPEQYRDRQSMPLVRIPADHYFVLGDHRSSSNDSRAWGPVHRQYIYGKAVFVYWPLDKMGLLH
ncbi:MAG: signal peptidase I [Bryobacteraceae bacterium]|nr:signal peptidase I [Bryobacteraceae bacterium]MDW8377343.1 signal peptidase I [Bryobacterales bacterium]